MPLLTDTQIKNAKPGPKPIRLKDEKGLSLEVSPAGGKLWRFRYWIKGKEGLISLGTYPEVSLRDARDRRDEARRMIANGLNPSEVRKSQKDQAEADALTFETMFREWHAKHSSAWSEHHAADTLHRMEQNILPWLGGRPLHEITSPELLTVIQRIDARGAPEQARRILQKCNAVFQYAEATGRIKGNPASSLRGAIPPTPKRHFASIRTPKEVAVLLRNIEAYDGHFVTRCALKFGALTFVRPGELRHAEWDEFDLEAMEWRIPASKMKMKEQHLVPLSRQALAVLEELRPLTGSGRYLFPSLRSPQRCMSENTVNAAIRRMGYSKEEMTGHGFRSMASTLLNERGFPRDAIERQLAHGERDAIRAAYNFAQYLPERRKMMQAWADYLDALREGAKVTPIRASM